MTNPSRSFIRRVCAFLLGALAFLIPPAASARVVDNFDDNAKTAWQDFTFIPGFGLPKEQNGEFRFELPPAGQAIFTASQKISEVFELKEGRTVEFRVDIIQSGGKDSFAVLAFIPLQVGGSANSPGSLAGYGFAKATEDVLITKGINRYFVADDTVTAEVKQNNITMVLKLTVKNGNVIINARALDKDDNLKVLWERTVVDTPAADVMDAGEDKPAAPFITTGYFTLYCYQDFSSSAPEDPYFVYYDNAEAFVTETTVLDDFNDNTKTAWQDFTFIPGFGLPKELNGEFRFELPPAGQAIFSASQKTSRVFELTEGEQTEFSVDIIESGGKDSFAVLAFLPLQVGGSANSPGTLAGYGFAKATEDVLITKGINRYFVADDAVTAEVKQNNITLVLNLTVRNGNVVINARALDKDNNNAVLWERTVVDTPAADVMDAGEDKPAAPFITAGYFTLYCYQDFSSSAPEDPYFVFYDNAVVSVPPQAANTAPIISEVQPADFGNFLPASTQISFKVDDDKALATDKLRVTINGAAAGGTITATKLDAVGKSYRVNVSGALVANGNYVVSLSAEDADGASTTSSFSFDTFAVDSLVIEVEDYNFDSGQFIDNPVIIAEGTGPVPTAYSGQTGTPGIDYSDTRTDFRDVPYRPFDSVRMQHTLDNQRKKFADAGGAANGAWDYDVGDIVGGEWMNYTRTFPSGSFEVYLRAALANVTQGEYVLEEVTSDPTLPDQTTRVLGSFLATKSGFQYRNTLLTDGAGLNKVVLRLTGKKTLRLRQVTADPSDGGAYQNYLVFIPTADVGVQRATVANVSPAAGSTAETVMPTITATIQNRDTSVNVSTVALQVNGQLVSATVNSTAEGATLSYKLSPLPPNGSVVTAKISFKDNLGVDVTSEWSFTISYTALDPANRIVGTGVARGLLYRFVQAPQGSGLENSLTRAEAQLAPNSTIPSVTDFRSTEQLVNFNKIEGAVAGAFPDDVLPPGLDAGSNGTDDFTVEMRAYLDLPAGAYRFGFNTDDGFKLSSGRTLDDKEPVISFQNGSPANNKTVDFVVAQPGLYPFRFVWYERGGQGHGEWFAEDLSTGERVLINDAANAKAIKAFTGAVADPVINVEATGALGATFQVQSGAVVDTVAHTITLPLPAETTKFYRINSDARRRILDIKISGDKLVLTYERVQ